MGEFHAKMEKLKCLDYSGVAGKDHSSKNGVLELLDIQADLYERASLWILIITLSEVLDFF